MKKRTVKSIPEYLTPEEMYERYILGFNEKAFTYAKTVRRARSLVAAAYVTGLRISNVLDIRKSKLKVESVGEDKFLVAKEIHINKRRKEIIIKDIPMPMQGPRAPFTKIVMDYAKSVRGDLLFPITRSTAYKLIRMGTGQWCHYFRSQCFSHEIELTNRDTVAQDKGVKNAGSLEPYDHRGWKQHAGKLIK